MDDINPYEPPRELIETTEVVQKSPKKIDLLLFISWPVVFGLNLIVPIILGWGFTIYHGRFGVSIALILFLVSGWLLCYHHQEIARKFILGGTFTALSQFFPVLQFFAGMFAIGCAEMFGLNRDAKDLHLHTAVFTSEMGGFVVTTIVGGILLGVAGLIGCGLTWITAKPSIDEVLYGDDAKEIA